MTNSQASSELGKIFIVGAGPSGLAAAWRLQQAGREVVVLESEDRVGGQLLSVRTDDGYLMEAGATVLTAGYDSVLRLIREIGMESDLVPTNSLMGFMRDGQMHYLRSNLLAVDAARTKLLSLRSKLKVARLAIDLLKVRKLLSYEDLSLASDYDVETLLDYCRRRGLGDELFDYLLEPAVRGGAGVPGDAVSVVEFFFLWQKVLGAKLFTLRDGYSSFLRRIADKLPDVRLGVTVTEITENSNGVQVTYQDATGAHVESGAGAIVSTMANRVPDIVPQLSESRSRFLRGLQYTSAITINLALSTTPDCPASFVVVPRPVSEELFAVVLEHNKTPGRAPAGRGLVSLFLMNQWTLDHMDCTDEEILAAVLPQAEKVLPGISKSVDFSRVNRWYPVLIHSHPGVYRDLKRFHTDRDLTSRIHLAGSFTSSGNVNTAATAGERAARELLQALSRRPVVAV
ncbi:protoporphyrinogen/coproporphyrinogen oxidase [Mycolicibacterium sphagni]|uniref:protoporphyrinogen/coproporphyrinogen oxidase n=1 Tax=Mycolicibacterium sphagni TaxID=1786 RepID=UPI0021F25F51|nr:NAD(P)/FAD-dependent oxidoreductase [Mycolicibacterium sphagni]MCV7177052.1 FAD-dependent oxidoreductase [Mycolicibacterium sphagni]